MEAFLKDVKHSFRMFMRSPSFTFTAIAALALGIGATTAIFSLVNSVLLKPVPFPDPDRLVMLMNTPGGDNAASPAKFQHWPEQSTVLHDVHALRNGVGDGDSFNVAEFGPPPDVWVPFQLDPNTKDQGHYFRAAGRLKPGVSLDQAIARLQVSGQEYRTKFPNSLGPKGGFSAQLFQEAFVG